MAFAIDLPLSHVVRHFLMPYPEAHLRLLKCAAVAFGVLFGQLVWGNWTYLSQYSRDLSVYFVMLVGALELLFTVQLWRGRWAGPALVFLVQYSVYILYLCFDYLSSGSARYGSIAELAFPTAPHAVASCFILYVLTMRDRAYAAAQKAYLTKSKSMAE